MRGDLFWSAGIDAWWPVGQSANQTFSLSYSYLKRLLIFAFLFWLSVAQCFRRRCGNNDNDVEKNEDNNNNDDDDDDDLQHRRVGSWL